MKLKKSLIAIAISSSLMISAPASAGVPVIDSANLANTLQNLVKWGEQLEAMKKQYEQHVKAYQNMNGVRGMANLVNDPALRKYLPDNYQEILSNGYGNAEAIRAATRVVNLEDIGLDPNSDASVAFEARARQISINRATYEAAYSEASARFDDIQVLLNQINASPDAKDIADLQARIQAEQVMQQNEANKLTMLSQLAKAQEDLAAQQNRELILKTHGIRSNLGHLE